MAGPTVKITRKFDPRALDALKKRLSDEGLAIRVGVKDAEEKDGTPLWQIAFAHEFGVPEMNIPERSFLRAAIANTAARYMKVREAALEAVARGDITLAEAMHKIGHAAKGDVQEFIRTQPEGAEFKPLKEATIKAKGSSKPLIDHGQLRGSIDYVIAKKGE